MYLCHGAIPVRLFKHDHASSDCRDKAKKLHADRFFCSLRIWFSFVVYSSLIGTIPRSSASSSPSGCLARKLYRHAGKPTSIPYRGWKRWHTIAGLSRVVRLPGPSRSVVDGPFPIITAPELTVPARNHRRRRRGGPVGPRRRAERRGCVARRARRATDDSLRRPIAKRRGRGSA